MIASPIAELRDVSLRFGAKQVLDHISLSVAPEERLVIIGQSGAGKTTILRLLLGLIAPTTGLVLLDGRDISHLREDELRQIRSSIGMVFEDAALFSSSTVRQNLALPLQELTNKSEEEIDRIVEEKLALVGLTGEGQRIPSELSGGMRKRVGVARALVTEPRLTLFDEPTAGLDPVTSAVIEKLIISLTQRTKVTSIITTPVVRTAFRLATRIAMLDQGKIVASGTAEDFKSSTNPVVARFIAASARSLFLPLASEKTLSSSRAA